MTSQLDQQAISIDTAGVRLSGDLALPRKVDGLVLFAHGSGSSRKSARNRAVAETLVEAGFATLLLDLLTGAEDQREAAGARLRFDMDVMAARVTGAVEWLGLERATRDLPLGLFGASTGAAAALIAAARQPARVRAVVSRGGRPDLADDDLEEVEAPTLLIVGGADPEVLDLNRMAFDRLRCTRELVVVPGASHLFEEPGALEAVARRARAWFEEHLRTSN
jgi:alpha-beta hydrolase superfamily lysophospholipase